MRTGAMIGFEKVEWFNGGLFDDNSALPLEKDDIEDLIRAAKLDWSEIDPSILGTLFERGLDPGKRSQLGAHYTDRDQIMQIIQPVVTAPLWAEWEAAKGPLQTAMEKVQELKPKSKARDNAVDAAESLRAKFAERLLKFRVLDPACGSGNFLYLALLELKNLELRVNIEAEAMGLGKAIPRIGPEAVLGIEINSYAAELARVSVWIGEIQWMRRNGFSPANNPILRNLDTIQNRDALMNPDGTRAEWPDADVVVGNPPFLGNKKMIGELGEAYTVALRKAWPDVSGGVDLVCYWFAKAWERIQAGRLTRAGFVSTNSIRGGANRDVLRPIVEGGRIFEAWSDEDWHSEGAAVRVSMTCFDKGNGGTVLLDGQQVSGILSNLSSAQGDMDLTRSCILKENQELAFQGFKFGGPFEISDEQAHNILACPINPNGQKNLSVVRRWFNGMDLTRRISNRWCIDFGVGISEQDASLFESPFQLISLKWHNENEKLLKNGKPPLRNGEPKTLATWWIHQRPRPEMRNALQGLSRFIATPEVSKHRLFVWLAGGMIASGSVYSIARDDDTTFGILHSRFHEIWSLRMGTFLGVGNDPRYTPTTTFETFPFPEGLTPNIPAADYAADPRTQKIAAAAARLNELRENWLNPADLVKRVPEVVPGYPDRILPVSEEAEKLLKKRTLTNLYNDRPAWLQNAHKALDEAVAEAYGWGEDWKAGKLTEDEILARLFRLNQERAAAQGMASKPAAPEKAEEDA